jgi:low affinity Fe/Cu permease
MNRSDMYVMMFNEIQSCNVDDLHSMSVKIDELWDSLSPNEKSEANILIGIEKDRSSSNPIRENSIDS